MIKLKKICAVILTLVFVTLVLPLAIVFVMDKTVDNSAPQSTEAVQETEKPAAE